MTNVVHNFSPNSEPLARRQGRRASRRGFTLIEIMVVLGIIVLLVVILLAVTSAVSRKAEVSRTQLILKGLDGIAKDYESETGQPLLLNGAGAAVGSVYPGSGISPGFAAPAANYSFVNLLYRLPSTRAQLEKLMGNSDSATARLVTDPATGVMSINDAWGQPIQYLRQGVAPGAGMQGFATTWTGSTRSYFRSAGPDKQMDLANANAAVNADDILSYEP